MNIEKEAEKLVFSMGNDSPSKIRFFTQYLSEFKRRVETDCARRLAAEKKAREDGRSKVTV